MNGAVERLHMTIEDACRDKWQRGVEAHGGGEDWVGADPAVELHDEALDALNYLAEIERRGGADPIVVERLRQHAWQMALGARLLMPR